MAAIVQASIATGAGPTTGSAEGGATMGRDDNVISTAVVPIPSPGPGTAFSYSKSLYLQVTGGTATNHINNRRILLGSTPPTGIRLWWQTGATYAAAAAPADADNTGVDGATPTGYAGGSEVGGEITTGPSLWDNTSVITATGQNGKYVRIAMGVDSTFVGGGGSVVLPSALLEFDEGP